MPAPFKWTQALREDLRRLWSKGSIESIAKKLGTNARTVQREAAKLGLTSHSRKGPLVAGAHWTPLPVGAGLVPLPSELEAGMSLPVWMR